MRNPSAAPDARATASQSPRRDRGLFAGLCISLLVAALLTFVVPQFRDVFAGFGAQLPRITQLVLRVYWVVWVLPLTVVALWLRPTILRRGLIAALIGAGSLLIVLPAILIALYLPIFALA